MSHVPMSLPACVHGVRGPNPAYACCDRALGTSTDPNIQPAIQLLSQPWWGEPYGGPGPYSHFPPQPGSRFGPGPMDRSSGMRSNRRPY